jgi:hypothetical protein
MHATGELLGMSLGALIGFGFAHLINSAYKHFSGIDIPTAHLTRIAAVICFAGGLLSLAYGIAKNYEREELQLV